jgi:hypothetical protein
MEQWEFHDLTKATVNRFLPRVPPRYVRGFERVLHAGEFSMAVDDLVLTLVNNRVPVTASEQEDLRRLLDHLNRPTSTLDELTMAAQS